MIFLWPVLSRLGPVYPNKSSDFVEESLFMIVI